MEHIDDFLAERHILVTGATGFVGQCLCQKLLKIPNIGHIWVLIRPSASGVNPEDRLEKLLSSELFSDYDPEIKKLISCVSGNLELPELGLSTESLHSLQDVSVVFHCGASVNFELDIFSAIRINLYGTCQVVELCRRLPLFTVLVHVSTAFVNTNTSPSSQSIVRETIEEMTPGPEEVLQTLLNKDATNSYKITTKIIGDKVNAYVYSKALSELYLQQFCSDLQIVIVRPSVIGAGWKDPFPGWITNYNALTGFLAAFGSGIFRVSYVNPSIVYDLVPIDIVINTMIAAAVFRAKSTRAELLPVIHCNTSSQASYNWGQLVDNQHIYSHVIPFEHAIRTPHFYLIQNKYISWFLEILLQDLPAIFYDIILYFSGNPLRLRRLYRKLYRGISAIRPFIMNEYSWETNTFDILENEILLDDRPKYFISVRGINWSEYYGSYYLGIKKYLLKEDCTNLELAKKRQVRIRYISAFVETPFYFFVVGTASWGIYSLVATMKLLFG